MDYEKLYKESLEKAREYHKVDKDNTLKIYAKGTMEYLFPELKESEDERIRKGIIRCVKGNMPDNDLRKKYLAWIEKQGEQKSEKVSIWKHWKDGIAGNGDDKQMFLIKSHNTYNLSSCLSFECDYIELSELEKLMEKQDKSKFEQCIQEGDEIVTNEDGTHFNVSQLERVSKKVTDTKETAKKFLKTAGIMDKNGELADEYRLEKQDEQKPTDKVEPKFKEGDWVVCEITGSVYQIKNCIENPNNHKYVYLTNDGYISSSEVNHYHLWTIQDAKDGDVLQLGWVTAIFKEYIGNGNCSCYCSVCKGEFEIPADDGFDNVYGCYDTHPATEEQCDLLFQKMKEAGYEWDAEKKELKKTEQNMELTDFESALFTAFSDAWQQYLSGKEVNVAQWAKEHSIELLEVARKEYVEWSEEDEEMLSRIDDSLKALRFMYISGGEEDRETWKAVDEEIKYIKSLKERVQPQNLTITDEELTQAKKEAYNDALDKIEYHSGVPSFDDGWSAAIWYLKKRDIFKPQSQWKPSEEQMKGIDCAIKTLRHQLNVEDKRLNSLYKQLKSL